MGITANIKTGAELETPDAEAELDSIDTVRAIGRGLNRAVCRAKLYTADRSLPVQLQSETPDFVFNIAEGIRGRGREAQVPALLDMLGIPYTGSDATTLCIALDKALTKRLLATYHVKTPPYFNIHPDTCKLPRALPYPIIVKPNAEGSSKGISDVCVAKNPEELSEILKRNARLYHEDMLAEAFIGGREFTVGLLGNGTQVKVFPPMEIVYKSTPADGCRVYSYSVKQDYTRFVSYECPARLESGVERKMLDAAKKIFLALNCRDFARVDFRLSEDGKDVYFIEINPLPGLAPGYSDYPMLADFCGMGYDELIAKIFRAAVLRTGAPISLTEAAI